jgi:predicted DNA-binding transcriptional regulator YafY
MRASRLVNLLLLLQTRGRLTAGQLAGELEVSERTIFRDVEALSAAGIPIYTERGPHGGVQLVDGYRTRLTGLTADEAEALFLSGVPGPASELGLGTVMAAARLKVLAALPPELRSRATRLVERFHLDAAGWFHASEAVPHLPTLAEAVWDSRVTQISYERGDRLVERRIQPLGVVLKAGIWYLVADSDGNTRTYRVSRVTRAAPTDEWFVRSPEFDLASYWAASTVAYERDVPRQEVVVRIDPDFIGGLADLVGVQAIREAELLTPRDAPDPDGWQHLRLRLDWPHEVPARLLALGDRLEALAPPALREQVASLARQVADRYSTVPRRHPAAPEGAGHGDGSQPLARARPR